MTLGHIGQWEKMGRWERWESGRNGTGGRNGTVGQWEKYNGGTDMTHILNVSYASTTSSEVTA